MNTTTYAIEPIGIIRSELANLEDAPRQGYEGAPDALPIDPIRLGCTE